MRNPKCFVLNILLIFFASALSYAYDSAFVSSYLYQGKYEEVIKLLKEEAKTNPRNPESYYDLGNVYLRLGSYKEAIKWFKEALKLNPNDSNIYLGIGNAYRGMGNFNQAIKWLKKGKEIDADNDLISDAIARVYIEQGKYNEAESILILIVKRKNDGFFKDRYWGCPFQALGKLYSHMAISGQKKKVLENYMKAAEIESYVIDTQIETAEICYEYGDYENAGKYVERAIRLDINPEELKEHNLLKGYILISMKKYKEAENIFGEIIKGGSKIQVASAQVGIGHIEISRKNFKIAEQHFQKMLSLEGTDVMANLGMAWLSSNQNEHQKALFYYEAILRENPSYILALLGKGNALMGLKRINEAEAIFKKVLEIEPENEYALAELGIAAYNKREDKKAEQLFNKALSKSDKTYTCPYEGLGLLYLEQGKTKEAEENFKKAIEINPDIEYKKYNGLAKIYIKQGKFKEAKELLNKSIQNYPYDDEAKELLKETEAKM